MNPIQMRLDFIDIVLWSMWAHEDGHFDRTTPPDTAWARRTGVQRPIAGRWFDVAENEINHEYALAP